MNVQNVANSSTIDVHFEMMWSKIFISYKRTSVAFTDSLKKKKLHAITFEAFFDLNDKTIREPGIK